MNCAVFASGGGSNFQALLDRKDAGDLHVDFTVCIGNNRSALALARASQRGISTVHIAPSHFDTLDAYTAALSTVLREHDVDMIALAGYMKMLPALIVREYHHRILNIHPALLPAFGGQGMYGKRVHQAVLDYGVKVSGITVHLVDEEYDKGPIVLQETIPVLDEDDVESLAARVLAVEHAHYWRAVQALARGTLRVDGRRVRGALP